MNKIPYAKIICEVYQNNTADALKALKQMGVGEVHIQPGRSVVLREKSGFWFLPAKTILEDDPTNIIRIYVPLKRQEDAINCLIGALSLNLPGRGTVYSEEITLVYESDFGLISSDLTVPRASETAMLQTRLTGICCIVQRGQGNTIVASALDSGATVPSIVFGEGTGLRDKLGLLRITIPAEKEMVTVVVSETDADDLMNVLVEAGKLDQPGKGFIFNYPVSRGLINSKIFRGKQKHAASMEQVILAIDELKGETDWRRRSDRSVNRSVARPSAFLTNLFDMTILCNDGWAMELVKAAMVAGASGATISKLKHHSIRGRDDQTIALARETANLIVSEQQKDVILKAVEDAGVFSPESSGVIEIRPSPKARTYLGKK